MSGHPPDSLGLEPDEMRRLGHWVVDRVVDHFVEGPAGAAIHTAEPSELLAVLGGPPPREPGDALAALQTLTDVALATMQHGDHPRYFARVPGPSSFAGVLGEWLATGFNAITASWAGAAGPTAVEMTVIDWLRSLLGLPDGTEGVLTSGGSVSSLLGLAVAREALGPGVAYLSDQTHASVKRALGALGFAPEDIRTIGSDRTFRLRADDVREAILVDRAAGRTPRIVVGTAGTVNSGAVDELPGLADVCTRQGAWFHVDGAYGGPAALCARGAAPLAGIERADSLALDPHKWLFQPYDIGCLLVRRPGVLEQAFAMNPEYLADTAGTDAVDFRDRTLELTRRGRAIKLWLTFHTYGLDRIRAAIDRGIGLAEEAERWIAADARCEIVTPAQLGIVTFAIRGADAREHAARAAAIAASGYAAVTSTTLRGHAALRLCTINPRTRTEDIVGTLERLVG